MGLINPRDLLAFPAGDHASDTLINGIHFNLSTLEHWNYTYYSNQTLSNGSRCFLAFEPYVPYLLENGTFLNSTTCYSAIQPLAARAQAGLFFACLFALSIILTLVNLRKHGRLFLPAQKRFRAVGRRWQWYWMLFVAGCALVSGVANVDVDRYYLPELPIVLSGFFWFLMLPTTMCVVWESVRHWGAWQERQLVDPNPFLWPQDDGRSRTEFWLPLLFYFWVWMNLFMALPRSWTPIELQRDPNQQMLHAEPVATDIRFKIAAFLLFGSWLTTVSSLWHSIKHYKPRSRGIFNRGLDFIKHAPLKFLLTLTLSLVMIGYEAACAFEFSISPLKLDTEIAYVCGLGWAPIAAILLVHEVAGYVEPNEDRELIRQRRSRGAQIDAEMGITRKPHWWTRIHGEITPTDVRGAIARNVSEIGGVRPTMVNVARNVEMGNTPVCHGREPTQDSGMASTAVDMRSPARTEMPKTQERAADLPVTAPGMRSSEDDTLRTAQGHVETGISSTTAAPQQTIRSMLDV